MADRPGVGHTTLALFLAAAILVGLFEDSDRERLRGPMHPDRFRLASAVQIGAVIMLGPWWAALVAAVGTAAAGLFHGVAPRKVWFDALAYGGASCIAGLVFEVAGGDVGSLQLLDDLVALVALGLAYLTVRALLLDVVRARENFDPRLVSTAGAGPAGCTISARSRSMLRSCGSAAVSTTRNGRRCAVIRGCLRACCSGSSSSPRRRTRSSSTTSAPTDTATTASAATNSRSRRTS